MILSVVEQLACLDDDNNNNNNSTLGAVKQSQCSYNYADKKDLTNTDTNYNEKYLKSVLIYNNYSKLETNIIIMVKFLKRKVFKINNNGLRQHLWGTPHATEVEFIKTYSINV